MIFTNIDRSIELFRIEYNFTQICPLHCVPPSSWIFVFLVGETVHFNCFRRIFKKKERKKEKPVLAIGRLKTQTTTGFPSNIVAKCFEF